MDNKTIIAQTGKSNSLERLLAPVLFIVLLAAALVSSSALSGDRPTRPTDRRTPEGHYGKGSGQVYDINGSFYVSVGGGMFKTANPTEFCNSCHDGLAAPNILSGQTQPVQENHALGDQGSKHPVDVAYPVGRAGYTPMSQLDDRIVLTDGKVTCGSCHATQSGVMDLAVSTSKSELCLTCHIK